VGKTKESKRGTIRLQMISPIWSVVSSAVARCRCPKAFARLLAKPENVGGDTEAGEQGAGLSALAQRLAVSGIDLQTKPTNRDSN
jgi:hypothetical protein